MSFFGVSARGLVLRNALISACSGKANTSTARALLVLALGVALPLADAAAAAAPDAGQILNEQRQHAPEPPRRIQAPDTEKPALPPPTTGASAGLSVKLHSVRFTGANGMVSDAELQQVVAPSIGQTLDHAALLKLASDVTLFLRNQGFVLARAYLPRQDLTAGNLEIALLDGRLQQGARRITVQGHTRMSGSRIAAAAESALPDGALRVEDLERAVLLVNDLSGITARSALERGDEPGTTRLIIDASEEHPFAGSVSADNFSNRTTGAWRGNAQIAVLDPFRLGDSLGGAFSLTSETQVAGLSYSTPITPSGLRLGVNGSYLHYTVGKELAALDLEGYAATASIGLTYPILRTRKTNLSVHGDFEHKRLVDDGLGINLRRRQINHGNLSVTANRFDEFAGGGVTDGNLSLSPGNVDLSGNTADETVDKLTARTQGGFLKVNGQISRLQSLGRFDGGRWSLFGTAAGQWASQNLDSSEKFILGGPNAVRAYPIGEAAGDEGWLASLELRRSFALPYNIKAQALGFVDAGGAWLSHRPWSGGTVNFGHTNYVDLSGVGLGVNAWAGRWSLRAAVAQAVGDNEGRTLDGRDADGRSSRQRVWVQASFNF